MAGDGSGSGTFPESETTELAGEGYNWLVQFPQGWRAYQEAKRTLRDEHAGVCQYGSAIKQFMVASGMTLFKGMVFDDLRRLQIDIETTTLDPTSAGCLHLHGQRCG